MDKQKQPAKRIIEWFALGLFACIPFAALAAVEPALTSGIRVKHVTSDAVYLEAGSSSGLAQGQRLLIRTGSPVQDQTNAAVIGEIEIESVTPTSTAGRILSSKAQIKPGDMAFMPPENLRRLRSEAAESEIQQYAQVVSFTEGKPPEQEVRESIPKPPLPEINRIRGRIAADYSALQIPGRGNTSSQFGFVFRLDAQRLGGTHWNVSGYNRTRIQSRKDRMDETLTDLINRTYHFSINYDNPGSRWVVGAGRLYVPWATSLSTIDGAYLGRRFGQSTVGVFGGTTPDPSSWNYDSDRRMGGVFVNFDFGSFESIRFTSTTGVALSWIQWRPDRQFGFFENGIFYKNYLSIYSNVEADLVTDDNNPDRKKATLSRSYLTLRFQPHKAISFDVNENYFRNIPTFDPRLIGTGLVDKFLFQGFSGGLRLELPYRIGLYASAGRSSRTGDQKAAWNYLGSASVANILHSGIRAEYRYSRFDSSFGRGSYQTLGISRLLGEGFRFEVQGGQQDLESLLTSQTRARFFNGNFDYYFGSSYFLGAGLTIYRGQAQSYNQYFFNIGYRFDNHGKRAK